MLPALLEHLELPICLLPATVSFLMDSVPSCLLVACSVDMV